jgi:hypothetical protein
MQAATHRSMTWPKAAMVAVTVVGMQVGTGGELTENYYKQRGQKGYALARYEDVPIERKAIAARTSAQDLAYIRTVLKSTVTELANLFGVSRQAIYDWQTGKQVAIENATKLEDLAKAAEILSDGGLVGSPLVMRRKIIGGKTLFDILREGGSVQDAARLLVEIMRHENQQREALELRLADRKQRLVVGPDDLGVPMLHEGG